MPHMLRTGFVRINVASVRRQRQGKVQRFKRIEKLVKILSKPKQTRLRPKNGQGRLFAVELLG